jgi:hypothetical protein
MTPTTLLVDKQYLFIGFKGLYSLTLITFVILLVKNTSSRRFLKYTRQKITGVILVEEY